MLKYAFGSKVRITSKQDSFLTNESTEKYLSAVRLAQEKNLYPFLYSTTLSDRKGGVVSSFHS